MRTKWKMNWALEVGMDPVLCPTVLLEREVRADLASSKLLLNTTNINMCPSLLLKGK